MFSSVKLKYECPFCKKELTYTLKELQKGRTLKCPHCGKEIKLEESVSGSVQKMENEVKDSLENISKKVTIRE